MMRPLRSIRSLALVLPLAVGACLDPTLERAAREPGAVSDPSGVVVRSLAPGKGAIPDRDLRLQVMYQAHTGNGTLVDDTARQGGAVSFPLNTASSCWKEAFKHIHVGEKARIVCPYFLAHDGTPPRDVRPRETLVYDVELVSAEANMPTVPGFELRTITPGTGPQPKESDAVRVHYEGKLPDGKVFDSSIARGTPAVLPLHGVISCWRIALPRMHVGEKAELVCPPELAYGAQGSPPDIPPNAKLTFQVELLGIESATPKAAPQKRDNE